MNKIILLSVLVSFVSLFGADSAAGEMKPYAPYVMNAASRAAGTITVSEPAAGAVIMTNGSSVKATWTVTTDPATYDRIVVLMGNVQRPGTYYQIPFTDALPKGGGSVSVPLADALYDQMIAMFAKIQGLPDIDPESVRQGFFAEVRGEVTSDHTIKGVPQYAVSVGQSGTFAIQKFVAPPPPPPVQIKDPTVTGVPSGLFVNQQGFVTATVIVTPVTVTPTAKISWGDIMANDMQVDSLGDGKWMLSGSHAWPASGPWSGTITIIAGGATVALPFSVIVIEPSKSVELSPDMKTITRASGFPVGTTFKIATSKAGATIKVILPKK